MERGCKPRRHPERRLGRLGEPSRSEEPSPRDSAGAEAGGAILTGPRAEGVGVIAHTSVSVTPGTVEQR